jgi:hypothetical protein
LQTVLVGSTPNRNLLLSQETTVLTCPATRIWITPPQLHISFESMFSAGIPPTTTVGAPTAHIPAGTGTHGIGVGTPIAAAVAAMTIGLAMLLHMPNGGTLTIGAQSAIVAAGTPPIMTRFAGSTTSELGAAPKLHCREAPVHTHADIAVSFNP